MLACNEIDGQVTRFRLAPKSGYRHGAVGEAERGSGFEPHHGIGSDIVGDAGFARAFGFWLLRFLEQGPAKFFPQSPERIRDQRNRDVVGVGVGHRRFSPVILPTTRPSTL